MNPIKASELAELVRQADAAGHTAESIRGILRSLGLGTIGDIRTAVELELVRSRVMAAEVA